MRIALALLTALLVVPAAHAASYRLAPADRRAITTTVDGFVSSAVQGHDLGASYDLVTPALKVGISRRAWAHGTTRVSTYPARGSHFGWTLDWATRNDVLVDVLLQPRKGAGKDVAPMIFTIELKRLHGRWLVDSFTPSASFAGSGRSGNMHAFGDFGPNPITRSQNRHVNRLLLVVPALVLLLILAVPGTIVLRSWRRNRRAERAYGESLRRELPPLPPRP